MKTAILLSFTRTLDLITEGRLSDKQLANAIFCFGCTRVWALDTAGKKVLDEQKSWQKEKINLATLNKLRVHLLSAEMAGRVVWRRELNPFHLQAELSKSLTAANLEPLNPNLPPSVENDFLKIAIERVNNKDGVERVDVFA